MSLMRLAVHEGQEPRPLNKKATSFSFGHSAHFTRRNPRRSWPQSRYFEHRIGRGREELARIELHSGEGYEELLPTAISKGDDELKLNDRSRISDSNQVQYRADQRQDGRTASDVAAA